MQILEFLFVNWSDILIVFFVSFLMIYSFCTNSLDYLKDEIFSLVTQAEKVFGGKTGEVKLRYVLGKIYNKMPMIFKIFLSEEKLKTIVENVLEKAKKSWCGDVKITEVNT